MHKFYKKVLLFLYIFILNQSLYSAEREIVGKIEYAELDELSGMVLSGSHNIIWGINDGKDNNIYGFDLNGKKISMISFPKNIFNNKSDIEDIAYGKLNGINYIFLGDFGDNKAKRNYYKIIAIPEPEKIIKDIIPIPIERILVYEFEYKDGAKDAETLLYDPLDSNLYIVSKREKNVGLYKLNTKIPNQRQALERLMSFPFGRQKKETSISAGDISKDGKIILIRDYTKVFFYQRETNENLLEVFKRKPIVLTANLYDDRIEPQGESIAISKDNQYFYTATETKKHKIELLLSIFNIEF